MRFFAPSDSESQPLNRMRVITTAVIAATVATLAVVPLLVSPPPWWQVLALAPSFVVAIALTTQWSATPQRVLLLTAVVVGELTWLGAVLLGMHETAVLGIAAAGGIAVAVRRESRYATAFGIVLLVELTALASLITHPEMTRNYLFTGLWYSVLFAAMFWLNDVTWRLFTELDTMRRSEAELAVMKERMRFAADLHDIQGHTLHVIKLKAAVAARLQHSHPERVANELADIERLTAETIDKAQQLAHSTRSLSFAAELANASALISAAGMNVQVIGEGAKPLDDETFALVLREGTTNILRHPRATSVVVTVTAQSLEISNDGAAATSDSLRGLAHLRNRVIASGGALAIERVGDTFSLRLSFGADS